MTSPLVSIVLPTYNRADFLSRAIRSVLSQKFTNWELIIWDDGSTDCSEMLVRSFSDERIRYFKGEHHGVAYARNHAIVISQGEYLAFLDSDDEWLPEKLSIQIGVMEENREIDVLFSNYHNINLVEDKEGLGFQQCVEGIRLLRYEEICKKTNFIIDNFLKGILRSNFISLDSVIIRKTILQRIGFFNTGLRNGEDFELWWRMGLEGVNFAFIDEILLERFKPENSLSSPSIENYENYLATLDFCFHEAEANQRKDLLPLFRIPYRSAWQGLIRQYALVGSRKQALQAFWNSLKYGMNWRSIYLLLGALAGPKWITFFRR